jgi:hypothetical protein
LLFGVRRRRRRRLVLTSSTITYGGTHVVVLHCKQL